MALQVHSTELRALEINDWKRPKKVTDPEYSLKNAMKRDNEAKGIATYPADSNGHCVKLIEAGWSAALPLVLGENFATISAPDRVSL